MSFVHLHVHSEYSLLDGFSNIKKLVKRAKEMDMPALALTDHGTMFGVIDFYNAATQAGIKPIIGVEAYLAARSMLERDAQFDKRSSHLLLLAENQVGYQNLLKIASAAQMDGFYYYPRIDHEFLAEHSEGLICTSGCMAAEVPRLINQGNLETAQKQLDWYYEVFGKDRFFLELQSHEISELEQINKHLLALGRRYDGRFVATNDVHYVDRDDARLQDILLAIQTGCVLTDPNRMRMTDNSYYLRSPEEMARVFAEVPEAVNNTVLIAERCSIDLGFKGYHLPEFEVPEGFTPDTYLRKLCIQGLEKRYGSRKGEAEIQERLNYELDVIHQMGFDTYFLIVWDLCRHARAEGIWYNARGSAAGSIVAYSLEITLVDPIEHKLIFERFLNPGRISMPDIDLDFRDDRRAEMMEYTARKYGDDKVAQIITFGTLGARAAIRDVGRVMDIPLSEVDKVAKLVPNIPGRPMKISEALEEITELKQLYTSTPYLQELIDTAKDMEGVIRNAGTHAAGVIITDKPIIEYIPLHRPTGSASGDSPVKTVTQFEMSILDSLGLLKVDFLGLATLTIMARACDLIAERHGIKFNLQNIPTDDPQTYEMLGRGETAGVFQVEGSGMRRWLMQMKPKNLDNVIAMVALFRPGPMDFIPSYISRMHGKEAVTYRHPLQEPILKETFGITVYQEQIMYTAMNLAGYSASEADNLRKGVAKKKADVIIKHRKKFTSGAVERGIAEETANAIFDDWEAFARYGFPKGHAADYGVIAVQTAYLKLHYPVEYMTALLTVSQSDTNKVALYVADCRRMGFEVAPPDINASGWDFTIEDQEDQPAIIRFGLGAVKNVGLGPVETILEARAERRFKDLNDFAKRVDLRHVGKRALESLVKVGALDEFGVRPALLEALDRIVAVSSSHFRAAEMGQMSLFGAHTGVVEEIILPPVTGEISRREVLNWERELIGLYVSDHPLRPIMNELTQAVSHFSGQLSEAVDKERVRVAGLIVRIRHHQSKAGKPMGFVALEDLQGTIELVIFPRTWTQYADMIRHDTIVLVDGKVDMAGAEPKVLVDSITTEFKMTTSLDPQPINAFGAELDWPDDDEPDSPEDSLPAFESPARQRIGEVSPSVPARGHLQNNDPDDWEDGPPPPDAFPPDSPYTPPIGYQNSHKPDLVAEKTSSAEHARGKSLPGEAARPEPETSLAKSASIQPEMDGQEKAPAGTGQSTIARSASPEPIRQNVLASEPSPATVPAPQKGPSLADPIKEPAQVDSHLKPPAFLASPAIQSEDSGNLHMITVILRSTGDKTRDVLRLRRIHGIITSYPGNDRFSFHVFERGRGYLLEFPNFTAGYCPELMHRLTSLVGPENVRAEPIPIL